MKQIKIIHVVLLIIISVIVYLVFFHNSSYVKIDDQKISDFKINHNKIVEINGPSIEVSEKLFDFGVVKYGDVAKHNFQITNRGSKKLIIQKLSTSCGCTKASVADSDKIISPGESIDLVVTFDPAVHKDDSDLGELQRIIYIRTNDSVNEETEIEITANVLKAEKFKTIRVTAQKWSFEPEPIEVSVGDYVKLIITSSDIDHSFTLPELGIDARIKPGEETVVEFLAQKKGTYEFYCNVSCGVGHSSMRGNLIIN